MALPARVFWTLEKLSVRWECTPEEIVGWATQGIIEIVISIGKVQCSGTDPEIGLVVVCAEDLIPLILDGGRDPKPCMILRIRPQGTAMWRMITDPAQGVAIELSDLLVTAEAVHRFEDKYDPLQRVHVSPGRSARHEWEKMLQALLIRLFLHGLPETQAALVAECQEWFVAHAKNGAIPDESQIRRKLTPIWRALNQPQ